MKKTSNRRSFLQKLAALTSGVVIASKTGMGMNNSNTEREEKSFTRNIKPLGFQWETRDPFLFCVHHEDFFPKGNDQMGPAASLEGRHIGQDFMIKDGWRMYHGETVPGFPGHPHRGFETITVVRKGLVDHTDSLGASGRYGNGDVQWMTAGKGVQHAEMFPLIHKDKENTMELFQIWLNLPKKDKMVDPYFEMLWGETIPKYKHLDLSGKQTSVEIIVGKIDSQIAPPPPPNSWASDTSNEVAIWNVKMDAGAKWIMPKSENSVNRTLYFYTGDNLKVGKDVVPHYHSIEMQSDVEIVIESGSQECDFLVLQGNPISEPVVQHGPFVMNNKEEIRQAFDDYQRTQFGGWPWDVDGPVHPRTEGRFAIHADGRKEIKG